jgi:hypothetical protein
LFVASRLGVASYGLFGTLILTLGCGGGPDASPKKPGQPGAGGSGAGSGGDTSGAGGNQAQAGAGGASSGGAGAQSGSGGGGGQVGANESCEWTAVDGGHLAFYMAAAPNVNAVYMLDKDQTQLYVTKDDGASWTALASSTTDGKAFNALTLKIIFDPADTTDNTFWAAGIYGDSGVYYTEDGGMTVKSTCFTHSQTVAVDLVDPEHKTILATDHGGGFAISTDGGVTCTNMLDKLQAEDGGITRAQVPYIIDSNTFLVATGGFGGTDGIWRSTDAGQTWSNVSDQSASQNLIVGPDGAFYYGLIWNRGLLRSDDEGASWNSTIGYGTLESGIESVTGTFIGDGRYVNVKMLTTSGNQQLAVSSDYSAFTDFLAPFPADHMDWPDQSVGVVYSKPANKLYTYTRYAKISRCDL